MKEYIKTEDLMNFLTETRQAMMQKSKDMSPKEFYIRDSMLLNFMQTVKQMSERESENESI